jgi:hypothetical protein
METPLIKVTYNHQQPQYQSPVYQRMLHRDDGIIHALSIQSGRFGLEPPRPLSGSRGTTIGASSSFSINTPARSDGRWGFLPPSTPPSPGKHLLPSSRALLHSPRAPDLPSRSSSSRFLSKSSSLKGEPLALRYLRL